MQLHQPQQGTPQHPSRQAVNSFWQIGSLYGKLRPLRKVEFDTRSIIRMFT
jgi:hypothetical protein